MDTLVRLTGLAARIGTDNSALHQPWDAHDTRVLIVAAIGIAIVVILIVWLKFHAFIALTIGAFFIGIASGIDLTKVTGSYEKGVGGTLGYVGVLIALGAMLGKLLTDSGGADRIVDTLLRGRPASLPWKMALIAGIIGIPMFFEVGLVLLVPFIMLAVSRSHRPAVRLGIPALAGLSVLHGFIPPHPGPLAAIAQLGANIGITLALGLLIAIPIVVIAGPLFGWVTSKWVTIGAAGAGLELTGQSGADANRSSDERSDSKALGSAGAQDPDARRTPSFAVTLTTILLPVALMLIRAAAKVWMDHDAAAYPVLDFIGDPIVALLIGVLLAMLTFGTAVGFSLRTVSTKIGSSLMPIVGVVFIVGAGGGFGQVLVDGGTGDAIAKMAIATGLSALLMGWLVAVLIRLATGSATVATVTASSIVAPLAQGLSPVHLALLVLSVGAGSLFFSHVNDGGFWLVKEYFGMTIWETIKSWSFMETLISLLGLGATSILWVLLA